MATYMGFLDILRHLDDYARDGKAHEKPVRGKRMKRRRELKCHPYINTKIAYALVPLGEVLNNFTTVAVWDAGHQPYDTEEEVSEAWKDFILWKTKLTTHLDSQPVPKDYLLIIRLSDQLFQKVDKPKPADYVKTAATATAPAVPDDKEFRKDTQRWSLTEGTIKKTVLDRIERTTLVDQFQSAATCFEGWEALVREVNFDKGNRSETLLTQLQKSRESDLDYADRMAELVSHLKALDYPDRTNKPVADAHDPLVAKKFRLGLTESRFTFLSPIFKKEGIDIVQEAQDFQLNRAQRQTDRDETDDRALAARTKPQSKKYNAAGSGSAFKAHANDPNKLFVGGLAWKVDDKALNDIYKKFGTITESVIVMDNTVSPSCSKGFGFVTFSSATECSAAISGLNGKEVEGRLLIVNPAKPNDKRSTESATTTCQAKTARDSDADAPEERDDEDMPIGFAFSSCMVEEKRGDEICISQIQTKRSLLNLIPSMSRLALLNFLAPVPQCHLTQLAPKRSCQDAFGDTWIQDVLHT
ncbi:hypothetical protein HDU67_000224 [Dinochytrium kinnereticum]|nr:hypothetical protein HDU67_000224 [Dinochytrium kinnereticum]